MTWAETMLALVCRRPVTTSVSPLSPRCNSAAREGSMIVVSEPVSTKNREGREWLTVTETVIYTLSTVRYRTGTIPAGHWASLNAIAEIRTRKNIRSVCCRFFIEGHLSRDGWVHSASRQQHGLEVLVKLVYPPVKF